MPQKACLVPISDALVHAFITRMPAGVTIDNHYRCTDRPVTVFRFSGEGLPDWCAVQEGACYVWAAAAMGADGKMLLAPDYQTTGMSSSLHTRIQEDFSNPN